MTEQRRHQAHHTAKVGRGEFQQVSAGYHCQVVEERAPWWVRAWRWVSRWPLTIVAIGVVLAMILAVQHD